MRSLSSSLFMDIYNVNAYVLLYVYIYNVTHVYFSIAVWRIVVCTNVWVCVWAFICIFKDLFNLYANNYVCICLCVYIFFHYLFLIVFSCCNICAGFATVFLYWRSFLSESESLFRNEQHYEHCILNSQGFFDIMNSAEAAT